MTDIAIKPAGAQATERTESAILNGRQAAYAPGETVLQVARREGVAVPTLCEFAALGHRPGTCRMCLVEVKAPGEDRFRLATACDTRMTPGLIVETRSARVREARRLQASLLFADHCETCSACARHGRCELQDVARSIGLDLGALSGRYVTRTARKDATKALVFTPDKCIRCLRCVEVCRSVHGIGAITFEGVGTNAAVGFDGRPWAESDRCIQCGQCTLVCPTGALDVRDEVDRALDLLADPDVITVFQLAPATRVAMPEALGLPPGENFEGRMVAGLKRLGADFVMDTRWSADVTILEEGTELIERLEKQQAAGTLERPDTMFTSCCPGWINHAEKSAPDILPHISSTRSPQAIFSALAKTWLPEKLGLERAKIRVISIMPCTAKKDEAARAKLLREGESSPDTDLVLTVRELARLFERGGVDVLSLEPVPFDTPFMTEASGAAQLFATTGGVMEAALRTVAALTGGKAPANLVFEPVRGLANTKEATLETERFGAIRVAVVYGIRHVEPLLEMVRRGVSPYHFVEVMACPGGCIGGGGTAQGRWRASLPVRQKVVYRIDGELPLQCSHQNPDVIRLYEEFLGKPGSHKAHALLHCSYEDRHVEREAPTFAKLEERLTLTSA